MSALAFKAAVHSTPLSDCLESEADSHNHVFARSMEQSLLGSI